ncbi:MAG: DUF2793 domain-containing protein [Mesorhizobium sp.]|nr:DUF2793 domain-containing protein [Mesorhizobium sp.]MBN9245291.1 DUF2793 domain-containing protein [Mesorhizobium sp.]
MENSPNLSLPYIMPSQAQKHVTHNEALVALDAIIQLAVLDKDVGAPPLSPGEGDRYLVAAGADGGWVGRDGAVAAWQDGAWVFYAPRPGWRAWVGDEGCLYVFDGAGWTALAGVDGTFETVGVNTTADATNKLAVSSPATLFNHAGAGHQLKLNKQLAGDTASLLFQTGFSGRAELGTAGNDDLHVKVSADGAAWSDVISIGSADSKIRIGATSMNFSTVNVKGSQLAGTGESWFGLTFTHTDLDATPKGGAALCGAPYDNANKPFVAVGPWAAASYHQIYYGGGGWGCPDATRHVFYTGSYQPTVDNTATMAFDIEPDAVISARTTRPSGDNTYSLGSGAYRWSVVYAATGTISTSDARLKTDIVPVPLGLGFIRDLQPVAYRWKVGGYDVTQERIADPEPKGGTVQEITVDTAIPQAGVRTHYGLVAQQVKTALDAHGVEDFAGWTLADRSDPDSEQGLRYDQFVPILVRAVQELAAQVEALHTA